jgi:hypothetical protein
MVGVPKQITLARLFKSGLDNCRPRHDVHHSSQGPEERTNPHGLFSNLLDDHRYSRRRSPGPKSLQKSIQGPRLVLCRMPDGDELFLLSKRFANLRKKNGVVWRWAWRDLIQQELCGCSHVINGTFHIREDPRLFIDKNSLLNFADKITSHGIPLLTNKSPRMLLIIRIRWPFSRVF